jgi:hypothetical protein
VRQFHGINDDCACGTQLFQRVVKEGENLRMFAGLFAQNAEPCAFERIGLQVPGVIALGMSFAATRGGIGGIDAGHGAKCDRDVGDAARHRSTGVE